MTTLIIGLFLFLGTHSIRIFAEEGRTHHIARYGEIKWKIAYSIVSVIGLVLIVWGYGQARLDPVHLWFPPTWTRHLAALLTIPAFILLAATYVPGTQIKAKLGHPMVAGVKLWAFAHLIANGTLADILLFGAFLAWAVTSFTNARRRDRLQGAAPRQGAIAKDAIAITVGLVLWFLFARYLHAMLFGIAPFG
ncbi:NnrU family protein [Rhodocyclaceae bacterium SMB388]